MAPCNTFHIMVHAGEDNIVNEGLASTIIEHTVGYDVGDNFLSLILAVKSYVQNTYSPDQKVGLLATKNTFNFGNILFSEPNSWLSTIQKVGQFTAGINAI